MPTASTSASFACPGTVSGGKVLGDPLLKMDGQAVFKLAVGVLEDAARATLAKAGKTEADIDWLIPHQANIRIMQGTAKKLKLPLDKLVVTVRRAWQHFGRLDSAGAGRRGAQRQDQEGRHAHAGRRGRRLHLGRGAAGLLARRARRKPVHSIFGDTRMKPFAFVFPGQGSQSVGMLDAWGDHPAVSPKRCRKPPTRWARTSAS